MRWWGLHAVVELKLDYVKVVRRKRKGRQARTKGVTERAYYYSVPPGIDPIRIPYAFGTAEFVRFVEDRNKQAETGTLPASVAGTFDDLIDYFRGNPDREIKPSRRWRNLAERTRKDYNKYIDRVLKPRFGPYRVRDWTVEAAVELHESFSKKPRVANHVLAVMNSMISVARLYERRFGLSVNPGAAVKPYGRADGIRPRNTYWTWDHEAQFIASAEQHDHDIYKAYMLLAYTGQRPKDVRAMMLADYDGKRISVVQSKTGVRCWIKAHRDLRPLLEAEVAAARAAGVINRTLVRTPLGQEFKERFFGRRWDVVMQQAKLAGIGLQRRDLRRTAVVRLFEAGCEVGQIAAITGHTLQQVENILEHYFVRTAAMSDAAITKLEDYQDRMKQTAASRSDE